MSLYGKHPAAPAKAAQGRSLPIALPVAFCYLLLCTVIGVCVTLFRFREQLGISGSRDFEPALVAQLVLPALAGCLLLAVAWWRRSAGLLAVLACCSLPTTLLAVHVLGTYTGLDYVGYLLAMDESPLKFLVQPARWLPYVDSLPYFLLNDTALINDYPRLHLSIWPIHSAFTGGLYFAMLQWHRRAPAMDE